MNTTTSMEQQIKNWIDSIGFKKDNLAVYVKPNLGHGYYLTFILKKSENTHIEKVSFQVVELMELFANSKLFMGSLAKKDEEIAKLKAEMQKMAKYRTYYKLQKALGKK